MLKPPQNPTIIKSLVFWFKYFDSLDLWAPVKVIIDTPLGGFVLKGTALKN